MEVRAEIIAKNLTFPEGPRWHGGNLWFSDFYSASVYTLSLAGRLEKQFEVPGRPSGLGWTPQGELLVVSMLDRKLLCWNGSRLNEVADLSALAGGPCNDMVVADDGTAFIGNFGFDIHGGESFRPTSLICVHPDRAPELAADDMHFPNGAAVVDRGRTLIVAESYAKRLTAFDLDSEGGLSRRRVWADLVDYFPDGICLDRSGGVWAAALQSGVIRVEEGGAITHRIALSQDAYACALTDDGASLLVCTSAHADPDECRRHRSGRIEKVDLTAV